MNNAAAITTRQKVTLIRRCFGGLPHLYGTYDPSNGRTWQVKAPVTDRVILDHIVGRRPYGTYLLVGDRTRAVAADFDHDDLNAPRAFATVARRYGIEACIERSKAKGYHAWIFLDEAGVSAAKARRVVHHILDEIGQPNTEIFPKQDRLGPGSCVGNFINVPLFGRMAARGRTVFLDNHDPTRPAADQWGLLARVRRVPESQLDRILAKNAPSASTERIAPVAKGTPLVGRTYGLPPCARRILAEGVTANQRVTCFRLAVQLKRTGVPQDLVVPMLKVWAARNRPTDGRRIITDDEIRRQVADAYARGYRSCGCEEPAIQAYCDPTCPVRPRVASGSLANRDERDERD